MGGDKNGDNGMGIQYQFVQGKQGKFFSDEPSCAFGKPVRIAPFKAGKK
jgi:hypothetical protein